MNQINPAKLLNSKWTAVTPLHREKHFVVTRVEFAGVNTVVSCAVESVLSKRATFIDWQELKDPDKWLQGWKQG